jgi:hypothetical protein
MELNTIYRKTAKGEQSIRHRTDDLPSDLRMVLLLINGMRDVGTLRMVSEHCRDSLAPLIFLEDNGFIEQVVAQTNVVAMQAGARPAPAPTYAPPAPAAPMPQPQPAYVIPQAQAPVTPTVSYSTNYSTGPAESILTQTQAQHMQDRVNALLSYMSRAMGEDAKMVYERIQAVRTEQEFQDIVKKLYTILTDYRGVKEAERFMQSFGK